jgi:hypothetical protein
LWGYSPQGIQKKFMTTCFCSSLLDFPRCLDQPLYDYGNSEISHCTKEKESKSAELLYDTQLGLNFLWSFLFFKWGLRGTAFIEIAVLLTLNTLTAFEFYKIDRTSGLAMIPYIAWVTLLFRLNFSIFRNN